MCSLPKIWIGKRCWKDMFLEDSLLDLRLCTLGQKVHTFIKFCESELNMSHNTTMDRNSYTREVCKYNVMNNLLAIGGPNLYVVIDVSSLLSENSTKEDYSLISGFFMVYGEKPKNASLFL